METIIEQLKDAVNDATRSGWSINRLANEAGVSRASVQEWYTGAQSSVSLETAAGLARFFGMRLTKPRIPKPPE